jgi:glycosyltransferase involved in cell wall biosynthesis
VISIVLPAFNESSMLEATVDTVVAGFRGRGEPFEVHIVENGSTDDTAVVARRVAAAHPEVHVASLGYADYGDALRAGLLASSGEAAVIFDVDYYDLDFAAAALDALDAGPAPTGPVVVVGSKRAPGSQDERTILRRLATAIFSTILRRLFGLSLSDTHGMKVVSLTALRPVVAECRCGADLFDTELIIRAERAGLRVAEIPVVVRELRPSRTSILRRVPRTVGGIIRLRRVLGRPPKR